jgi:hypothetical protein
MTSTSLQLGRIIQRQFGLLTLQFLLGMAVNLIGLPDEVHGVAKTLTTSLLVLHVVVALGLLVGAIQIARAAASSEAPLAKLARVGGAAIGASILGGILTLSAPWSNLWSYLMAVSFIAAFAVYGRLYSKLKL